ncbi:MAG: hypothetical protein GY866_02090 [Proteobacteria bacterium]|nr:hypothetical protein [Pseudomonadota bacterium]
MSVDEQTYARLYPDHYKRLMESGRVSDYFNTNVYGNRVGCINELNQDLKKENTEATARFERIDDRLSSMSQELQKVERSNNAKMQAMRKKYKTDLESLGKQLKNQRKEYTQLIQEQNVMISKTIQNKQSRAKQWQNDVRQLQSIIDEEYRHDKFLPGRLASLKKELVIVQRNLENEDNEAAISAAQQTYLKTQEMRIDLERLESEWQTHLTLAKRSAAEVLAICDAQEIATFVFEAEEGSEEIDGEIDFWTEGELSKLRQRVIDIQKRLQLPDELSLDEFKQIVMESESLNEQCLNLTEIAKKALVASQLRNNIAQLIEDTLADTNWETIDSTYQDNDFRKPLHVKMKNFSGDEIVTIITPEEKSDNIMNRINISFFDRSSNDESYRLERLNSLMETFSENGLDCTKPSCVPGTEHARMPDANKLDFERLRQTAT